MRGRPHDVLAKTPVGVAQLLVVGGGPVARALVALGVAAGHHVRVAAGPGVPSVGDFDGADEVMFTPDAQGVHALRPHRDTSVVICTESSVFAAEVARGMIESGVEFVGVVGIGAAGLRSGLESAGVATELLEKLHAPAGLMIGAHSPEEIAVSVMAKMVYERRVARASWTPGTTGTI